MDFILIKALTVKAFYFTIGCAFFNKNNNNNKNN